jgi:hypothetical protein
MELEIKTPKGSFSPLSTIFRFLCFSRFLKGLPLMGLINRLLSLLGMEKNGDGQGFGEIYFPPGAWIGKETNIPMETFHILRPWPIKNFFQSGAKLLQLDFESPAIVPEIGLRNVTPKPAACWKPGSIPIRPQIKPEPRLYQ